MSDQTRSEQQQPSMFPRLPRFSDTMQKSTGAFWKTQGETLDRMKEFTEGWFQRRHIGVQAAQEACERMCAANSPTEWLQEYQQWAAGAAQRLMADSLLFQQGVTGLANEVAPTLVPTISKQQSGAAMPLADELPPRAKV